MDLKQVKFEAGTIAFVEVLDLQGAEIRIAYKGSVSGDEIRFTRNVGEFARLSFR